ncbi:ribosome recycling factor [Candidatus Daviesbacteria bacterium]|nr:ribosome recycling factor [Candidatus Daviesbacteria bacterium]
MDPVLNEANQRIQNALNHLKKELSTIRAGRANPTLIEEIPVNAYGAKMKLLEVGTITTPQPSLLTVQVWDPSLVKDVEKAILEANIGLMPSVDGQVVRLPIPPLTQERREEYVKQTHQKGEVTRVEMRQIRADIRGAWEKAKDAGDFGEDELFRREKLLQELINKMSVLIDELVKAKEEELKQI